MLKLRIAVCALLAWLAFLFNIERIHEPINIASFVYIFTAALAVIIICIPKLRKSTLIEITAVSIPFYAGLKWYLGYEFFGDKLPLTITECCVILTTNILAWVVAKGIDDFLTTAGDVAAIQFGKQPVSLEDGESQMYMEVQRARRFNRELCLATMSFSTKGISASQLEKLTEQAQAEIVRKFIESRIGNRLMESTDAGDLIVYQDGQFVLLFPEGQMEKVRPHLELVSSQLSDEFGIPFKTGVAQFPDEECTLTGLMERAEADMAWPLRSDRPANAEPDLNENRERSNVR